MRESETPTERYRRFGWECLEIAYTFPPGDDRTVLLAMAQLWQRLADQHEKSISLLFRVGAGEQPAVQQQQQVQPDGDK